MENGKCVSFTLYHALGSVHHLFLKREIPIDLLGRGPYYDLITPYGYGGPIIEAADENDKKELAQIFFREFRKYCQTENIVSEFIRFHPILKNAADFKEWYATDFMRNTIQTRLVETEDPLMTEYSPSVRRCIRKALEQGVEYKVSVNPPNLDQFKDLYFQTMNRNKADAFYYFNDAYFEQCLHLLGPQLVVVEVKWKGHIIAMSLNFVSNDLLHVHLTGSLEQYHHLYAPHILQYALLRWGMKNGMKLIRHGGGRTNDPDDKLYLYKKKYGRAQELEFYTGKKIWNLEIYNSLCTEAIVEDDCSFFPAYRRGPKIKGEIESEGEPGK
nr:MULTISPECIES: GNAT family N-acetyltransferase [unclassified Planococcus (in: firmicutes)]